MEEELRSFIAHREDDLARNGSSPESARRQARVEFGAVEHVKDEIRDAVPGTHFADSAANDLRYALRMMRRALGFTIVAVLTLALGIGGNAAIFSVVKAVLLDPLPYAEPDRLVLVWNEFREQGLTRAPASGFELAQIRERTRTLESLGGIWAGNGTFTGDDYPEHVRVGFVTENFFEVLGRKPLLGRTIERSDADSNAAPVLVLSHALWQRRFGGRADIIGQPVRFEGRAPVVIGVMPPDFQMMFPPDAQVPANIEAWAPFGWNVYAGPRDLYFIRMVGRLRPGARLAQANEDLAGIGRQLSAEIREFASAGLGLSAVPLHGDVVREARPALLALSAGIALVLLIACVNVANLLLARAAVREHEMALRAALGAARGRIVRQLLLESLLLAAVGCAAGMALGWASLRWLTALAPVGLLPATSLQLDFGVLLFSVVLTLFSGLLFGIVPALDAARVSLTAALQEAGRSSVTAMRRRSRAVLIAGEIALSFVLLVGAGLMLRTFVAVQRVEPGFRAQGALTFEINLPGRRYRSDENRRAFVRQCQQKLREIPSVEFAGAISHLPLDDYPNWYSPFAPEGASEAAKKSMMADHRATSPEYFRAIGAELVAGRLFDPFDQEAKRAVVVVDERLAREAWPNESPIGKKLESERFVEGNFSPANAEVIGVIRHVQQQSLTRQIRGQIYIPYEQSARPHVSFVVRGAGDPAALTGAVRAAVKQIDPDLALAKVRPMTEYLARAMSAARFTMVLAAIFGAFALLLAAVGIYGVVAYSVNQRTREFGVRLALGARPADLLVQVMGEGMSLAAAGIALGCVAALALAGALRSLIFGVSTHDPLTFLCAVIVLPAATLVACWLPARRAAAQDPVRVLRAE